MSPLSGVAGTLPSMEIIDFVETLAREGELMAQAAERAGTDAPVPTCPDWRVADLLRHTGAVHRWAAGYVGGAVTEPGPFPQAPDATGSELLAWFREGHAALVRTLGEAPADVECWTFLPTAPSPWGSGPAVRRTRRRCTGSTRRLRSASRSPW